MNLIADNFNIYLHNIYNLDSLVDRFGESYKNVLNSIKSLQIDHTIKKTVDRYPKYPIEFKYLTNTTGLNLVRIYDTVTGSVDELLSSVNENVMFLKSIIDHIPTTTTEIVRDIDLQYTIHNTMDELYYKKKFILSNRYIKSYDNLFYYLIGDSYFDYHKRYNPFEQIALMYFISTNILRLISIQSPITGYIALSGHYTIESITENYQKFIDNDIDTISYDISSVIASNVFLMVQFTDYIKNTIADDIKPLISKFPKILNDYLIFKQEGPQFKIARGTLDVIQHLISVKFLEKLINADVISKTDDLQDDDYSRVMDILSRFNQYNIQQYMYLAYLYRDTPLKFINILSMIIQIYVETEVFTPQENFITLSETLSKLGSLDKIDLFNEIENILIDIDLSTISEWWRESNYSKFVICHYYDQMLDEFIESDNFKEYLEEILKTSADSLIKTHFIDRTYNWYRCFELIKAYFKAYFKYYIPTDIFDSDITSLDNDVTDLFNNNSLQPPQYIITKNLAPLRLLYNDFLRSIQSAKYLNTFMNNLYLSSITKQIYYNVFGYFVK